jgi:SAM-dependent methyltransferase
MARAADDHYFTEKALRDWSEVAEKHRIRDEYFLERLQKYFRPGSILEIGAATGHLSAILKQRGYDVTASDISPLFVTAIAERGVPAKLVDATYNIKEQAGQNFDNILAQNVFPLIHRHYDTFFATLSAIHAALRPEGRLICICAQTSRCRNPDSFLSPREQLGFVKESGLFRVVKTIPHQVIPTRFYKSWNAPYLNFADFAFARIAAVRLVSVFEKIPRRAARK